MACRVKGARVQVHAFVGLLPRPAPRGRPLPPGAPTCAAQDRGGGAERAPEGAAAGGHEGDHGAPEGVRAPVGVQGQVVEGGERERGLGVCPCHCLCTFALWAPTLGDPKIALGGGGRFPPSLPCRALCFV